MHYYGVFIDSVFIDFLLYRQGNFYPKTELGNLDYIGHGKGKGFNVNICWSHEGIRDVDYVTAFEYIIVPLLEEFKPNVIIISAGFDAGMLCIFFVKSHLFYLILLFVNSQHHVFGKVILFVLTKCSIYLGLAVEGDGLRGGFEVTPQGFATFLHMVSFFRVYFHYSFLVLVF